MNALPDFGCAFRERDRECRHARSRHHYDESDGTSWCELCFSAPDSPDPYHRFDEGK